MIPTFTKSSAVPGREGRSFLNALSKSSEDHLDTARAYNNLSLNLD
jgi:hypothetical protein